MIKKIQEAKDNDNMFDEFRKDVSMFEKFGSDHIYYFIVLYLF